MRAWDILLALLIVTVGSIITASHRGLPSHWQQSAAALADMYLSYTDSCAQDAEWRKVDQFAKEIDVKGYRTLVIYNPNGQVILNGGKQRKVQIEVVRYGRGRSDEEAFRRGKRAGLNVSYSGSTIKVIVSGPNGFPKDGRLDLRLTSPTSLGVKVGTTSGLVKVQGMSRGSEVATVSLGALDPRHSLGE